jgi:subtilisin family serine protease
MRRIAALALAGLVSLPMVSPVAAADPPPADPAPTGSPAATPSPEPTSPAVEPTGPPTIEPTAAPTIKPTAEPVAAPTAEPVAEPVPAQPDPTTPTAAGQPTPGPAQLRSTPKSKPAAPSVDSAGRPIASGRYIVMLSGDADPTKVLDTHRAREGTVADRAFKHALRGFTAHLDKAQRAALLADPTVLAVIPDEVIEVTAQTIPTGVSRVGGRLSGLAKINGVDERVNADVAIVDTGIGPHADLNIAGGYNCSTTDRTRWYDENGHGTHVAGTVGARDNTWGVVGVAPGVRLWAVRILNSSGYGLLSWYVCGLDWILAQRDPNDSSRPMIEAVNMSVAKSGKDDGECGTVNSDILHAAICRLHAAGITVAAAAANARRSAVNYVPAAYNEVITVSALADTDGKPGGLGGNRCYSWGTYDRDDTFADFSNYGSDIDLIAPGKCIMSTRPGGSYGYSSGTSMAAPHVAGAAALYKSTRPLATPAEVREALRYLGSANWARSTDPDPYHEPLLRVERIGVLGTFSLSPGTTTSISSKGGAVNAPFVVNRSSTFFERVRFRVDDVPSGWSASFTTPSVYGWTAKSASVRVTAPSTAKPGSYHVQVSGTNWGRTASTTLTVNVIADVPTARAPTASVLKGSRLGRTSTGGSTVTLRVAWPAATDPSDPIARYEVERSTNGGAFGWTVTTSASSRAVLYSALPFGVQHQFRVRAQDTDGSWSAWATASLVTPLSISDRSSVVTYRGSWWRSDSAASTGGRITSSRQRGASARYRFTGRAIAVIAPTSTTRGKVSIYVNGVYKATVDLRSASTVYRKVVYSAAWASSSTRTIELRVAGTTGRPTVSLDGFVVLR